MSTAPEIKDANEFTSRVSMFGQLSAATLNAERANAANFKNTSAESVSADVAAQHAETTDSLNAQLQSQSAALQSAIVDVAQLLAKTAEQQDAAFLLRAGREMTQRAGLKHDTANDSRASNGLFSSTRPGFTTSKERSATSTAAPEAPQQPSISSINIGR